MSSVLGQRLAGLRKQHKISGQIARNLPNNTQKHTPNARACVFSCVYNNKTLLFTPCVRQGQAVLTCY